jgi:glycosyltransferase involved in cell wall biosynthesis
MEKIKTILYKKKNLISIVIPVYNIGEAIKYLLNKIYKVFDKENNITFEILLINDFSNKKTKEFLERLPKRNNLKIFNLEKNIGQHAATIFGFARTKGDFVITMDDDSQHDPRYVPMMLKYLIKNNLDAVFAKFKKKKHNYLKNFFSGINNYLLKKIFNLSNDFSHTSFRILKKKIVKNIINDNSTHLNVSALCLRHAKKISNYTIEHNPGYRKKTSYNLSKQLDIFLTLLFEYSSIPLKFVSYISLIFCMIFSFFSAFIIFNEMVNTGKVPGWASVMTTITIFSSLILFFNFINGLYLIKLIKRNN